MDREAKNHGIDVITLSHDIVMDWPQILEDAGRAAKHRTIVRRRASEKHPGLLMEPRH